MSSVISIQNNTRTNTCPHGLPLGACPICNGMGGGGKKMEAAEKPKNKDQWSWMKCYMQGQMMKAQENRQEANRLMLAQQIGFAQKVGQNVNNFIAKMQTTLQNIQNNLPPALQSVFAKAVNTIISPLLNLVAKIPQVIEKIEQFIISVRTQILAVAEKLSALLGEVKNFIEKKLYNNFKKLTKKLLGLFIWETNEENYKNEEELEIFKSRELRKIKNAILHLQKKGNEDECIGD